jgi:hypothetical protein
VLDSIANDVTFLLANGVNLVLAFVIIKIQTQPKPFGVSICDN